VLPQWPTEGGLKNILIERGKPSQNATNESYNGKFRDECLAMYALVQESAARESFD